MEKTTNFLTKEQAAKYDGPVMVKFNGELEACHLIDGTYFLWAPVKELAKARGLFCTLEQAEEIIEAKVLNIRL
jgi:hypothetical protein